jgi:hypothetical protein
MEPEPKQYLVARLRQALATDPRVNELDIHVKIAGDRVFLTGWVATPQRRDAVSVVTRELLPDHEIHNSITVMELGQGREVEHL